MAAVREGTPAAAGLLIQFPLYGGIFGMIAFTGLSSTIADWLAGFSSAFFYPALITVYSCVLGVFVPSGGSKWVIEAPYVIDAANQLASTRAGWSSSTTWARPARTCSSRSGCYPRWPSWASRPATSWDTFSMFLACFPTVLVMVTVLAPTLPFP